MSDTVSSHLHSKANPQKWLPCFPCISYCCYFPFDAANAETSWNQNCMCRLQGGPCCARSLDGVHGWSMKQINASQTSHCLSINFHIPLFQSPCLPNPRC